MVLLISFYETNIRSFFICNSRSNKGIPYTGWKLFEFSLNDQIYRYSALATIFWKKLSTARKTKTFVDSTSLSENVQLTFGDKLFCCCAIAVYLSDRNLLKTKFYRFFNRIKFYEKGVGNKRNNCHVNISISMQFFGAPFVFIGFPFFKHKYSKKYYNVTIVLESLPDTFSDVFLSELVQLNLLFYDKLLRRRR